MTKLTTYNNPIANIEKFFNEQFNLIPVFHDLDQVYRTGDSVRFSINESAMNIDIDLPGAKKEDTEMTVDSSEREVYITAKRTVRDHQGEVKQKLNRSFSIGREYDLTGLSATQSDGVLSISVPRIKKDTYIKKVTIS